MGCCRRRHGFWLNELCKLAFSETLCLLLLAPIVEETAKYLAIQQAKSYSLLVPAIFVVSEVLIQQATAFATAYLGAGEVLALAVLYVLLSLATLRHFLFYAPVYLCGYKLHGLPVAIGLHAAWNWYMMAETNVDGGLSLLIIALAAVCLVPLALYRANRSNTPDDWLITFARIQKWQEDGPEPFGSLAE